MRTSSSIARRIGPHVHRLQPKSLRGRLAVAATILSLVSAGATFALSYAAAMRQVEHLSAAHAGTNLRALQAFFDLEKREVDLRAGELAGDAAIRSAAASGVRVPNAVSLGLAIGDTSGCVVCADSRGNVIYRVGAAREVESLRTLASGMSSGSAGLAWLPSGTAVVSRRPIRGPTGAELGWVAVARTLGPDLRARFMPLSGDVVVSLKPADSGPKPDGVTLAGFTDVSVGFADGASSIRTLLPGLDGPAGLAELRVVDSSLASAMRAAGRVALLSGALAGVLGAAFGLALAQAFAGPISRMSEHVKTEGAKALEGEPITPLVHRPETSSDFIELTTDFDELLAALGERQSTVRAATEQARAAEASLRSVLEDSPEAKILVEDERITLVNRSAERILGVPASSLIGRSSWEVIAGTQAFTEDGERVTREVVDAAIERPLLLRIERDGDDVWVEVKIIRHEDDENRFLITGRDVTEQRRIDELREELFSLVSHDLRAPLTVVQGYLDILDRPLAPEARKRALDSARHNAAKMADLLEDLLDVAGAEQVMAPKVLGPVDLDALAHEVAESLRPTAVERRLEVVTDAGAIALGEERRLRQALVNLVTNALKYTPAGSTVCIHVDCRDRRAILAVEDDGPGVPLEAREAIFERFGRAASAEGKPGLGLGLYIVRLIAEHHGGSARVEDAASGGARFVLELPLARPCEESDAG